MSHWTYVQGTVKVTIPFGTVNRERLVDYINWSLDDMKHRGFDITGSEGPAEKFVAASRYAGTYASNNANEYERGIISITGHPTCVKDFPPYFDCAKPNNKVMV